MDQTLKNTLGICALLAFCFGAAIASGYHLEYEYGYRYSAVGALASVVFLLLLARGFPRVSSVVLLIYVGTTALYLPVGWLYGAPSYQIVGSILESNPAEARICRQSSRVALFCAGIIFHFWLDSLEILCICGGIC
ncbi:hypothetical protein [Neisseria gonorrhoeae]|uniref:hypothetical protein n=1 Tax=Neisseria gonorrhoeae TaxID=485 RepID=UPI001E50927A